MRNLQRNLVLRNKNFEIAFKNKEPEVLLLAGFGFSYKLIAAKTNITVHKVKYILGKWGVRVTSYRNGFTIFSRKIIVRGLDLAKEQLFLDLSHKNKQWNKLNLTQKQIKKQINSFSIDL